MAYPLLILRSDGATLDLQDGVNYATDAQGLFDLPSRNVTISQGYQGGGVFQGTQRLPRQFALVITILAGWNDTSQIRNATHNAARDALIGFFPEDELLTLRTAYPGTADYWDLPFQVQQMPWQSGTSQYTATCIAPDPALTQSVLNQTTALLDAAHVERIVTVNYTGNVRTAPTITLTPTAAKTASWQYQRTWTVTNNASVELQHYPIMVPFDFSTALSGGKIKATGGDIRVIANGLMIDRYFGNFGLSTGKIWVEVDIPSNGQTDIQVIYGNTAAVDWVNVLDGPLFDLSLSDNTYWRWYGKFMDAPGYPTRTSWQWHPHYSVAQGMAGFTQRLGSPWLNISGWKGVNAAGGSVPVAANVQGYAGLAIHHPLFIHSATFHGYTQLNPASIKFVLRGRTPDGITDDLWSLATDTSAALASYPQQVITFPTDREAVVFALRSLSVHTEPAGRIGGADDVMLQIATPPTTTGGSEIAVYTLDATIENETTGDLIKLFGTVAKPSSYNTVIVNCEDQLITQGGANFFYAFSQGGAISRNWLRLTRGINTIRIRDENVQGLTAVVNWHLKRL